MHLDTYFNNTSIRKKLILSFLLFVLTLFYFMFSSFKKELSFIDEATHLTEQMELVSKTAHLITQLQRERGLLAGFLSKTKTESSFIEIRQQIAISNQHITTFEQLISLQLKEENDDIHLLDNIYIKKFKTLLDKRKNIHLQVINPKRSINLSPSQGIKNHIQLYSNLISNALKIIQYINKLISNNDLSRLFNNYFIVLNLQELAGQERALLNVAFLSSKLSSHQFQQLSAIISKERSLLSTFNLNAEKAIKDILNKKLEQKTVRDVVNIRDNVLSRMPRQEVLNTIQGLIGYGGLIHLFKNYVMRGEDFYFIKFNNNFELLLLSIKEFSLQPSVTEKEIILLNKIKQVFQNYQQNLLIIKQQKASGETVETIDRKVKIDDSEALQAIAELQHKLTYLDHSQWWKISTFRVDQFNLVSTIIEKQLSQQITATKESLYKYFYLFIIFSLLSIILIFSFIYFLYKRIVVDMVYIADTMKHMHKNQLLDIQGKDEIAVMANAFNHLIKQQHNYENKLTLALKKAESGVVAKSQFLSTMSHEIRTPLNGVLGMSELLAGTKLDPEQTAYIKTITRSGNLLLKVINDVLDFSKLEAHGVSLELIPCNIEKLAFECVQLLSSKASGQNVELLLNYHINSPTHFIADPARLRQIFLNLLNNALKFTHKGHVLLEIYAQRVDNTIFELTCSVQDTGIGIEKDKQVQLFESFTQAEQSTTRKYGGTGLGLSICKQLVNLMGSEIQVESTLGKGSNFFFTIQLEKINKTIEFNDKENLLNLRDIKLLAVDDNPIYLSIIEELCQHVQINCSTETRPETVLDFLISEKKRQHEYDVILLDHHMPIVNGHILADQIHQHPDFASIKLILLTSGGLRGDAKKCQELGFSAYHTKPIRSELLIQSIKNVLLQTKTLGATQPELITTYMIEDELEDKKTKTKLKTISYKAHILLAEDNKVNQKVALSMLTKLDLSVDIANDGQEAIAMKKKKLYDLIFMDCQMPQINGFDATRKIRSIEKDNEHIPIIALTANALIEDKEKCLEAGMDAFIAKPFKQIDLINELDKWLKSV